MPKTPAKNNTQEIADKKFNNSVTGIMTILLVFLILFGIIISIFQVVGVYGMHEIYLPLTAAINTGKIPGLDGTEFTIGDYLYSNCYEYLDNPSIKIIIQNVYSKSINKIIAGINDVVSFFSITVDEKNVLNILQSLYNVGQDNPVDLTECKITDQITAYLDSLNGIEANINAYIDEFLEPVSIFDNKQFSMLNSRPSNPFRQY